MHPPIIKLATPAHRPGLPRQQHLSALLAVLAVLLTSALGGAAPSARILRIDPRATQQTTGPVLTTVIEIAQSKRIGETIAPCAGLTGNSQLDCMSEALEKPFALYEPFPFPAQNAIFTVAVDGTDVPAKYVSHARWGDSLQQPGVGTAWLVLIDADRRMGRGFDDAKAVAKRFVASMGPGDIVNLMFFNDRQVVQDSKWLPSSRKNDAVRFVDSLSSTYPSQGRNRSLLTIIKTAATDGFKSLGNVGETVQVPMHQAMVLLSSGFGGTDPSTTGPGAIQLQQYLTGGRFPEDNTALPKSPVPVVSVYFPHRTFDEFRQNSLEFMQNLADPEIGGFFTVVQDGQGESRGASIVNAVRTRFSKMYIVKWSVACIAPSITQSFKLVFNNVKPPILGDNSFKDVPVGIDPTTWPLAVNRQYTQDLSRRNDGAVYPGGHFKVYGDFCWGGDKSRAEVYFLPSGQQLPTALSGADIEKAKQTQQQLIAMGMKGSAVEANDSFVEFEAPDNDKILQGSGDSAVVRLVVYDNKARRTSGVTASSILELKATTAPFPLLLVLSAAFGVVVLILLVALIFRGSSRRPPPGPPTAPVVAGPPYGGAGPGGYGAPPGYGPPGGPVPGAGPRAGAAGLSSEGPNGAAKRATLQGSAGMFTLLPGTELRAGRDGRECGILLSEPRVSGVHASVKLEHGQLLLRDENSNNGTELNGSRLAAGVWTPVQSGSLIRFGPVEFSARLE